MGLADRGVGLDDKILIHADDRPEMVVAWLACAILGAVGVTTNTRSVGAEVGYFIEKAQCVAAITQPQYAALVADAGPDLGWIAVTEVDGGDGDPAPTDRELLALADLSGDAEAWAGRAVDPMRPVGILFTSGTTSRPKAVVHTHANALWAGRVGPHNIDLTGEDTYLVYLPFFHVNAQSWSIWAALGVGATIVLQPKFSASRFWEVIAKHRVTHLSLIPFVQGGRGTTGARPQRARRCLRSDHARPRSLAEDAGIAAYGMTETVIHAIHADPRGFPSRTGRWVGPRRATRPSSSTSRPAALRGRRDRRALGARNPRHPALPRVRRQPRGERQELHRGRLVQDGRSRAAR